MRDGKDRNEKQTKNDGMDQGSIIKLLEREKKCDDIREYFNKNVNVKSVIEMISLLQSTKREMTMTKQQQNIDVRCAMCDVQKRRSATWRY